MPARRTGPDSYLVALDKLSVDIDLWLLRRVNSPHEHPGSHRLTWIETCLARYDKRLQLVDTQVLQTDVCYQRMQYFTFSIADITLQFGEKCHGCGHRHILKRILFPVLSHRMTGNNRGEVSGDDLLLPGIGHEAENARTVAVDCLIESVPLSVRRIQHNVAGRFDIVFPIDVQGVSFLTVSLTDNGDFQRLCIVVERIAHLPDRRCHHEPLPYLLRILAHHLVQLAEDGLVLLG